MSRRNYRAVTFVGMLLLLALAAPQQAQAQYDSTSPFGIGFQSSWPSYGISGLYDLNEQVTLQAILGALGTVTNLGGRGIYRFQIEDKYNLFGFGSVGVLRYGGNNILASESAIGLGGGAGVELDWRRILSPDDDSFPPIYSSFDIGISFNTFENYGGYNSVGMGGGIHYRF